MQDQADRMIAQRGEEDARRPNTDNIPPKQWEQGRALDRISGYVLECEVSCVWQGFELTAVGTYDCGELIEIRDIEIGEKI